MGCLPVAADRGWRVEFLAEAEADIAEGVGWYDRQRLGLGRELAVLVRDAATIITAAPHRWPLKGSTRRYILARFPYTIAYRVLDEKRLVVIEAVAHQKRDPATWSNR